MLIIPDIHHKIELAERVRANHPGLPAIYLGDYFDDFHDTPADMETTCKWLQRRLSDQQDTFLIGNHCFAYLACELGVRWGSCSGWTPAKQHVFHQYFPADSLLKSCKWMVNCQGWLISHAGLTRKLEPRGEIMDWVQDAERALTAGVMHPAFLAGAERGGLARHGGILWCDWNTFEPIKGIRQIVGHTPAQQVRYKGDNVCLDTHLHHYGLLEDGALTVLNLARISHRAAAKRKNTAPESFFEDSWSAVRFTGGKNGQAACWNESNPEEKAFLFIFRVSPCASS